MAWLRTIFLPLSSILLLYGCAYKKISKQKVLSETVLSSEKLKTVIPDTGSAKYKAEIDVLNKHFTGIIVLKRLNTQSSRIVFVTELGMRMFDFSTERGVVKTEYVFEAMNKPNVIQLLQESFGQILLVSCEGKMAKIRSSGLLTVTSENGMAAIEQNQNNYAQKTVYFSGKKKQSLILYENNYETIKYKRKGLVGFKITLIKIKPE